MAGASERRGRSRTHVLRRRLAVPRSAQDEGRAFTRRRGRRLHMRHLCARTCKAAVGRDATRRDADHGSFVRRVPSGPHHEGAASGEVCACMEGRKGLPTGGTVLTYGIHTTDGTTSMHFSGRPALPHCIDDSLTGCCARAQLRSTVSGLSGCREDVSAVRGTVLVVPRVEAATGD